jgi:[acyl-carrier-protein] S-malonyltransferase
VTSGVEDRTGAPVVFLFPGQSSKDPDMISSAVEQDIDCRRIVRRASDIANRDLLSHYRSDNASIFAHNGDIQLGVFLANHLRADLLRRAGIEPTYSVGMSLGEYNHLVDISAISFEDAVDLILRRGAAYDDGPPGCMAAVAPLSEADLRSVLERDEIAGAGVVEISNFNSPHQHVIAGDTAAVHAAIDVLDGEFFVQAVIVEDKIPMHCSLFGAVAARLRDEFRKAAWSTNIRRPYVPNVRGEIVPAASRSTFADCLTEHVFRPVLWRASIERIAEISPNCRFVEVGPKTVLYNLLTPRWFACQRFRTDEGGRPLVPDLVEALRSSQHAE